MGQYYLPTILKRNYKTSKQPVKAQLCAHDFGGGIQLMEHSYVHNNLVRAVEYLLSQDKKGQPFVWAGDYAEDFQNHGKNLYFIGGEAGADKKTLKKLPLVKAEGYYWQEAYQLDPEYVRDYRYAINHTKKLYVAIPQFDEEDWTIHPLPLLTAESNGLGGGDYWGKADASLVGTWKYDRISVGDEVPKGFAELKVRFKE